MIPTLFLRGQGDHVREHQAEWGFLDPTFVPHDLPLYQFKALADASYWSRMWYDTFMPAELPQKAIDQASAAVDYALQVRKFHRRRSDCNSAERIQDIDLALSRLKAAMRPLRSAIGGFQYGPTSAIAEANRDQIRLCSAAIQKERRKLWKLRHPNPAKRREAHDC